MSSEKISQMTKNANDHRQGAKGPRRTAKSAETRARIILGALETLEIHGIAKVTTRKIAHHARVQLATLHYHFENKEALLLAVLDELIGDMVRTYERELPAGGDLPSRIEALIRSMWAYVLGSRPKQLVQLELTCYALRTKGSEWLAAKQYESYVSLYSRMLRIGAPISGRAREIDYDQLSRFILSGIDGLIIQLLAFGNADTMTQSMGALIRSAQSLARGWEA